MRQHWNKLQRGECSGGLYNYSIKTWRFYVGFLLHFSLVKVELLVAGAAKCEMRAVICFFTNWRSTSCLYSWATYTIYSVGCINIVYTAIVFQSSTITCTVIIESTFNEELGWSLHIKLYVSTLPPMNSQHHFLNFSIPDTPHCKPL